MLNRVVLIGRLTREPELRYTANGKAVTNFTLAVDRNYVDQQGNRGADFIRIVVWGKTAEACANYLHKGSLTAVDGRIQTRTYEIDGQKRYATDVVAELVRFLSRSKKQEDETNMNDFSDIGEEVTGVDVPF